ncbi:hypothetical protein SFUMM280S_00979 [Streptomyces fumanus]
MVAESLEAAREGADAVRVAYEAEPHDVTLTASHPDAYTPENANGGYPAVREHGDPDAAFAAAEVRVDVEYRVPPLHNHPMEPHASTARWDEGHLVVRTSTGHRPGPRRPRQGVRAAGGADHGERRARGRRVRSKGTPRPDVVLAAMAARHTGRTVTVAFPRRRLPAVVGHRAPTLHRLRLGAGRDGGLVSLSHEVTTHSSRIKEFVEQAAVPARVMYAAPHLRSVHRVVRLDVPTPSWMRARRVARHVRAGVGDGQLAAELGVDPVELRVRNEPAADPDTGRPFSSRHLVECLREGARRFGWAARDSRPRSGAAGALLIGTGVAAATYPVMAAPSRASAWALPDGTFLVRVNATDIGTGARTVLAQVAADALGVPLDRVGIEVGSTELPEAAPLAGGSSGTASWGWAVHEACARLADRLTTLPGPVPEAGLGAHADTAGQADAESRYSRHAFGAHFAEVAVDAVGTGEVRVRRMLGVYAAGRILNARTARSQFVGGMTMGLGMALTEGSHLDPAFGDFAESDLASYHVPAHADVTDIEAHWLQEDVPHLNPMGGQGDRGDRHRRLRGGDRQRRAPRHRHPVPGAAADAGPGAHRAARARGAARHLRRLNRHLPGPRGGGPGAGARRVSRRCGRPARGPGRATGRAPWCATRAHGAVSATSDAATAARTAPQAGARVGFMTRAAREPGRPGGPQGDRPDGPPRESARRSAEGPRPAGSAAGRHHATRQTVAGHPADRAGDRGLTRPGSRVLLAVGSGRRRGAGGARPGEQLVRRGHRFLDAGLAHHHAQVCS